MSPPALALDLASHTLLFIVWATRPQFFTYGEEVTDTKLRSELIIPHAAHFRRIYAEDQALTYTKSQMRTILKGVREHHTRAKTSTWVIPSDQVASGIKKMDKRLRTAFRHVMQAKKQDSNAPWYRLLNLEGAVKNEVSETADTAIDEEEESEHDDVNEDAAYNGGSSLLFGVSKYFIFQ